MTKPRSPCPVVGDPAEARDHGGPFLNVTAADHRGRFMNDGFIETRAPSSRLIDDIGGDTVTHKVRRPTFSAVRSGLQARCGVSRPVHHNDRCSLLLLVG